MQSFRALRPRASAQPLVMRRHTGGPRLSSCARWSARAAALSLATAATTVFATPIQYLSGASTQTSSSAVLPTVPLLPGATGFERRFVQGLSAASSQTNGAESASASASLQSGALRVSTAFASNGVSGGQTSASAFIGDGFAFSGPGGAPYVWNGQTVTFNIDVSGVHAANIPTQIGPQKYFDFSLVALMIYQPGTLQDSPVPFCNGGGTTNVVASFFWSLGSNTNATDPCGNAFLGNLSGTVNQTVAATFAPTGDFAWALGLRAISAAGGEQPGPISWSYQFGNTVEYDFVAPADAVVTTASGIAPGGQPGQVPVPATGLLLAAGVVAMAGRAARSQARERARSRTGATAGARPRAG